MAMCGRAWAAAAAAALPITREYSACKVCQALHSGLWVPWVCTPPHEDTGTLVCCVVLQN